MKRRINKRFFITAALLLFVLCMQAIPALAAQTPGQKFGLDDAAKDTAIIQGSEPIPVFMGRVIQAVLSIVGVIFLVLMIWAGALWMTSGGNDKSISRAKEMLKAAIIGLTIVMVAYSVTYFIVENLTNAADRPTGQCNPNLDPNC